MPKVLIILVLGLVTFLNVSREKRWFPDFRGYDYTLCNSEVLADMEEHENSFARANRLVEAYESHIDEDATLTRRIDPQMSVKLSAIPCLWGDMSNGLAGRIPEDNPGFCAALHIPVSEEYTFLFRLTPF